MITAILRLTAYTLVSVHDRDLTICKVGKISADDILKYVLICF